MERPAAHRQSASERPSSARCFRAWRDLAIATVVVLVTLFFFLRWEMEAVRPPSGVNRLSNFAARMPTPQRIAVVQDSGDDLIVWIGSKDSLVFLASGPPCYVFDRRGELVRWVPETGEGGDVDALCSRAWRAEPISLESALEFCRSP